MPPNPPPEQYRFKPGHGGGPGRPKGLLTRGEVESVMGRFSRLKRDELQEVIQNTKSTMLEIMVASVMVQAAKQGDASRLSFLLDRSVGRVKEIVETINADAEKIPTDKLLQIVGE